MSADSPHLNSTPATVESSAEAPPLEPRRIELHRRAALIEPERINIRPSRRAVIGPLVNLAVGLGSMGLIALGLGSLPTILLVLLLLIAVITIPSGGLGVVYNIVGSHVVIDRQKQSATWQQGMIGLGIGTEELVPFWKIAAIVVEEAGETPESGGRRVEEFAQWQIVLEKESGKRLTIGTTIAARSLADDALTPAVEVATAIATLTGAPLRFPESDEAEDEPGIAPASPRHRPRPRRSRRRARGRR